MKQPFKFALIYACTSYTCMPVLCDIRAACKLCKHYEMELLAASKQQHYTNSFYHFLTYPCKNVVDKCCCGFCNSIVLCRMNFCEVQFSSSCTKTGKCSRVPGKYSGNTGRGDERYTELLEGRIRVCWVMVPKTCSMPIKRLPHDYCVSSCCDLDSIACNIEIAPCLWPMRSVQGPRKRKRVRLMLVMCTPDSR